MKFIFSIFCLTTVTLFGQMTESEVRTMVSKAKEAQLVTECSRFLQENFYHFADITVDKLLKIDPKNGNYNYRKGFILLGMNKDPEQALKHLEVASAKTQINYDIYNPNEKAAPIDVFFHMGVCHHRLGNLDKALTNYNKFLDETQKNSTLIPEARVRVEQVATAKKLGGVASKESLPIHPSINTEFNDQCPMISADGKSLLLSSARPRENNATVAYVEPMFNILPADIYQVTKARDNSWSEAAIFPMNEPKVDEKISFISNNERKLSYSSWNDPKLYMSEFNNGSFGKEKDMAVSVDNKKDKNPPFNMQFNLSSDGNTAYFVSNALSGAGGWDLFVTEKSGETWGAAKALTMLNSPSDELAPFISLDGKTLYFASNSKESMGGFDIFKAKRDENGMWSKPVNLGNSVNTFSDEISFSLTANGKMGFVSSNRIGGKGGYDVYALGIDETPSGSAVLNGRIVNTKGKPIPENSYMTLRCTNCANTMETVLTSRMRDGVFVSSLEKCKEYEIAYYYGPDTKKPYTDKFKTNCDQDFEQIDKRLLIIDEDQIIIPFPTYELKGVVVDITTKAPIPGASIAISMESKTANASSGSNGIYTSTILDGYQFEDHVTGTLNATANGYLASSAKVDTDLLADSVVSVNFQLEAVEKGFIGGPYLVNYQFDRHYLTEYSKNKLKEVIKVMNDNPTLQIDIRSHTDSRGPAIYNQWLSDMRAKTAMEYLKANVVNPDRITAKGYGETQLLKPCGDGVKCTEAEHLQNRRTEFVILK
jgi:outer membrane protein OmpA-like peptidoglycan-associated protein/tetratricopeptide (TPR) repeat protein